MINNSTYWIVAKNKPNQERTALINLERQDFECFQPTFKTISRINNKFKEIIKPVFPGYIFIAINLEGTNWHKINNTRGISQVIAFGSKLPIIPHESIKDLRNRFSECNITRSTNQLEVGMQTEVTNGPFTQLVGKIDEIDADQRVWILLDVLGAQTRVSINKLNLTTNN